MSLIVVVAFCVFACAAHQKAIKRSGISDYRFGHLLAPGSAVHVINEPDHPSRAMHEALVRNAEKELERQGFEAVSRSEAEFLVFLYFGSRQTGESYRHYFTVHVFAVPELHPLIEENAVPEVWRGDAILLDSFTKNPKDPEVLLNRMLNAALANFGKKEGQTLWYENPESGE